MRRGWKAPPVFVTIAGNAVRPAERGHAGTENAGSRPAARGGNIETGRPRMNSRIDRRQFQTALGWGAAVIALGEFGLSRPAAAEESFTLASTGATWGEGLRASFVDAPRFEEKAGLKVQQEFAIDSVFTAKAMATCGT